MIIFVSGDIVLFSSDTFNQENAFYDVLSGDESSKYCRKKIITRIIAC